MSKIISTKKNKNAGLIRANIRGIEEALKEDVESIERCVDVYLVKNGWNIDQQQAYYEAERDIIEQALKDKNTNKIEKLIELFTKPNNTQVNIKELAILTEVVKEDISRKAP